MKFIDIMIGSFLIFLLFCSQGFAQYSWPETEIYEQNTIEKKSSIVRSTLTGNFKKISDSRYLLKESGKGDYGTFKDTLWTLESETELRKDLLCPLYTIFTIKDKGKRNISFYKAEYDYKKNIIRITQQEAGDQKNKELTLPLKAPTTDYATFVYFLRPFIADLIAGKTIRFSYLTAEPGLYTLKARFVKEDLVLIGSHKVEAIQVAIRPDMGAFNLILDRLVPPTLLWYGKKAPYVWLQYEGLESGRGTAHIITTVKKEY